MADFTPMQRGHSRVFLIEGGPRPDHTPAYKGCMMAGAVSQDFGDTTNIECPSPDEHNAYEVVGEIQGEVGRVETTLTGHYALDLESDLLRLGKKRCRVDVVIVSGDCTSPSSYNIFKKAKHLHNAKISHHETTEEGSLKTGDNAEVDESADLSAAEQYEVMPMVFERVADALVTNDVLDVVICDKPSCGSCDVESDGCEKVYAISKAAGGSAGTPADVIYTIDKGANWATSEIDSLGAAEDPDAIACVNGYVVVVSEDSDSIHYVLQSELDATGDETWTEIATGIVTAGHFEPRDIWSTGTYAFIAANGGYVYGTGDPTAGVDVLNAATATDPDSGLPITDDLLAIHALNNSFCVAVGNNGAMVKTENGGVTWTGIQRFTALGVHFQCVWCVSEEVWWIGTTGGRLYYTVDGGTTFTEKAFSGSGAGYVYDIAFSNDAVGYMAHGTATRGRIFRTHSGGGGSGDTGGWYIQPETGMGTMPASGALYAVAACRHDVNLVVGVGVNVAKADGLIIWGED